MSNLREKDVPFVTFTQTKSRSKEGERAEAGQAPIAEEIWQPTDVFNPSGVFMDRCSIQHLYVDVPRPTILNKDDEELEEQKAGARAILDRRL